ncbi:MAG: NAD(P)-dependent oxidoreductase [Candidatus Poribacteria bacterium]
MDLRESKIGIIGLGQMGSGISANLVKAGYNITGYDLKADAIKKLVDLGGYAGNSTEDIIVKCDVVLVCVEGRDSIKIFNNIILPNARNGQVFIDHSTVPAPETRRIGQALVDKGCQYLDAPISGGSEGAAKGILRIFVGGDKATFDNCLELFNIIGNPEKIVYCGKIGMGQIGKVVQQLTVRFPNLARLEVMVFGLRAGLDLETVMKALDVDPNSSDPYSWLYKTIKSGEIEKLSFEYAEWDFYLQEAKASGFYMPMLEAMFEFCKDAEKTTFDPLRRPEPSIWNELMKHHRN